MLSISDVNLNDRIDSILLFTLSRLGWCSEWQGEMRYGTQVKPFVDRWTHPQCRLGEVQYNWKVRNKEVTVKYPKNLDSSSMNNPLRDWIFFIVEMPALFCNNREFPCLLLGK